MGLPYRIQNINHKKELLRGLLVVTLMLKLSDLEDTVAKLGCLGSGHLYRYRQDLSGVNPVFVITSQTVSAYDFRNARMEPLSPKKKCPKNLLHRAMPTQCNKLKVMRLGVVLGWNLLSRSCSIQGLGQCGDLIFGLSDAPLLSEAAQNAP